MVWKVVLKINDVILTIVGGIMFFIYSEIIKFVNFLGGIPILNKALNMGKNFVQENFNYLTGDVTTGAKAFMDNMKNLLPGVNKNVNIQNTFQMTVPHGTTEQQQQFLQDYLDQAVDTKFNKEINHIFALNP
jgi:hypothetical protein